MISARGLIQGVKGWLGKPIAAADTDPQRFISGMFALPNPDPILRELGRAEQVYYSIMADAHVIGELRSIRGSFRSHQYRLVVGDEDDAKAAAAMELCEKWMASQAPNSISDWMEVMWQMTAASLPQQQLITLANREMSKALTSQAMIGEQLEVGAKAAAETAKDRQGEVHDSDRDISAAGVAQIFKWITLFNFGEGVAPPTLEFFKHTVAGKDRAETYDLARKMGARPSRKAMLEELDIPEAEDDEDALLPDSPAAAPPDPQAKPGQKPDPESEPPQVDFNAVAGFTFARAAGMTEDEAMQLAAEAADQAIEDHMIAPVFQMLVQFEKDGKTLQQFHDALADLVGEMDDEALREVVDRAISYSMLRGAAARAA